MFLKDIISKIGDWIKEQFAIWTNSEGWKYITVYLIGNLFPVWFLVIIYFANNGYDREGFWDTVSQPYTYLILSVGFASSTLYLWIKNMKSEAQSENYARNKISIGIILYVLVLFPIIGFFLSMQNCLETYHRGMECVKCIRIIPVIYWISGSVVFIYIYFQLKDFHDMKRLNESSKTNVTRTVANEVNQLNNDL